MRSIRESCFNPALIIGLCFAAATSVVCSCALIPGSKSISPGVGHAKLILRPQVVEDGYKALAALSNYSRANINHLVIRIYFVNSDGSESAIADGAGNQIFADLRGTEFDNSVTFSNLQRQTRYRIRCFAYKAPGESSGDLISTSNSTSFTDVYVQDDDRPTMATLKVRLIDVVFSGEAMTPNVNVTGGDYQRTGNEQIGVGIPRYQVSALAGSTSGYADGLGSVARFTLPFGLAADSAGNVFVADSGNHRVRKVGPDGMVTTVAGSAQGFENGEAAKARFNQPRGIAVDRSGTLYVTDTYNNQIRVIGRDGTVTTLAGNVEPGLVDAAGDAARFNHPTGIAVDETGAVFVADTGNNCIRKIAPDGHVSTVAGSRDGGFHNGLRLEARFNLPAGIAQDRAGNLFIADAGNHAIRKMDRYGVVITFAGNGDFGDDDGQGPLARFDEPQGIAVDSTGTVYVADTNNNYIRRISTNGTVETLAGTGYEGFVNGGAEQSEFAQPVGITLDQIGRLYIADYNNGLIRLIAKR